MLKFDTKQLREDVRQLVLKGINGLSEADYRLLFWKTACLPGPPTAGDGNVSPMRDTKIAFWRTELWKRLRRIDRLEQASVISRVPGQDEEKTLLEDEADELAQLILDAEEEAPATLLPSSKDPSVGRPKSVIDLERDEVVIFDGGKTAQALADRKRREEEERRRR